MTDTRLFYTVAVKRNEGLVRWFFGFNHHKRAIEWLNGE